MIRLSKFCASSYSRSGQKNINNQMKNKNKASPDAFNAKHGVKPVFDAYERESKGVKPFRSWRYSDDKDEHSVTRKRYKEDKRKVLKAYLDGTFEVRERFKTRPEPVQYYEHQNLSDGSREENSDAQLSATSSKDPMRHALEPTAEHDVTLTSTLENNNNLPEKITDPHMEEINNSTIESLKHREKLVQSSKADLMSLELKKITENYKLHFKKYHGKKSPHF